MDRTLLNARREVQKNLIFYKSSICQRGLLLFEIRNYYKESQNDSIVFSPRTVSDSKRFTPWAVKTFDCKII